MKKIGRPNKYDFTVIRKGKWVAIPCDNVISCRASLRYYAEINNIEVVTKSDAHNLLVYRL